MLRFSVEASIHFLIFMPHFRLAFVLEKKLFDFLNDPKGAFSSAVRTLVKEHSDHYVVKDVELRNDKCPEAAYPKMIDSLCSDIKALREEGFCFTLHAARAIAHSDDLDRDILAALERDAHLCQTFGIPLMVTHASFSIRLETEKSYYSIMHLMPKLNVLSEKTGVRIAIENISLKNGMLQNTNDHLYVLDYLKKNHLNHLGLALDFGHALSCGFSTEYVSQVIEQAKEKFFHIHAHETEFGEDLHSSLDGKFDWKQILQLLEKIKYEGVFVLELRSPSLPKSVEYLKNIGAEFSK